MSFPVNFCFLILLPKQHTKSTRLGWTTSYIASKYQTLRSYSAERFGEIYSLGFSYTFHQAIMAEGKEHALCVGNTVLSTEDIYVSTSMYFVIVFP